MIRQLSNSSERKSRFVNEKIIPLNYGTGNGKNLRQNEPIPSATYMVTRMGRGLREGHVAYLVRIVGPKR